MTSLAKTADLERIRAARETVTRRGYDMKGIIGQLESIEQALEDELIADGTIPPPRDERLQPPTFTVTVRRSPETTENPVRVEIEAHNWKDAAIRGVRADERHLFGHRFTAEVQRVDHGRETRTFDVRQPSNGPTTAQRLDAAPAADDDARHGRRTAPTAVEPQDSSSSRRTITKRIGKGEYAWSVQHKDLPGMAETIGSHAAAHALTGDGLMGPGLAKLAARCYLDYAETEPRAQLDIPNEMHYALPPARRPLCGRTRTPAGEPSRTTAVHARVTCTRCRRDTDFPVDVS